MMLNTKAVSLTVPSHAVTAEKETSEKHQQTGSVRGERWAVGTAHQTITLIGSNGLQVQGCISDFGSSVPLILVRSVRYYLEQALPAISQ